MSYSRFRHLYAEIMDPRLYTIEWLDGQIADGSAVAFANDGAGIVVQLRQYPAGAIEVHGICAAGELESIVPLIEQAEEWGRLHGATLSSIESRKGWVRILKEKGYDVHQYAMRKDLTNGD